MDFLPGMNNAVNLHPMFVHFPIVLVLLSLLSEIIFLISKTEFFGKAAGILLNFAAVSAIVAMYFGYRAADILGHDSPAHDQVHVHRDIMLWFTWLTVLFAIIFQFIKQVRKGIFRFIALLILSVILVIGADRGAELVFRYGMGVSSPPEDMILTSPRHDLHEEDDTDDDDDEPDSHPSQPHSHNNQHDH